MWVSLIIIVKLLIIVVVLIVMFSKNGQSRSNQIDIMGIIGVDVIAWLESEKGGRRLTGEYGQLIIKNRIVATILSVLAVFIMHRNKVKKGMERVGLIFLATLGIIILVGAEALLGFKDVLTVYLAMEAQGLAFHTLAGLLLEALTYGIYFLFGTLKAIAQMISYEVLIYLIILIVVLLAGNALVTGFHTEYSAVLFVLFFLSEYGHVILMSYFNVWLFREGWLPIISLAPFTWIPEVVWLGIKVSCVLFLFIGTHASILRIRFDNLMHLEWKSFLPLSLAGYFSTAEGVWSLAVIQTYVFILWTCIYINSISLLLAVSTFVTVFFIFHSIE